MKKKDFCFAAQEMFETVMEEVVGSGDYEQVTPEAYKACMDALEDGAYLATYFKGKGFDDKTATAITDGAYAWTRKQYELTTSQR